MRRIIEMDIMMKTINIWIACSLLLISINMSGQITSSGIERTAPKNANKENVYIHYNTSLLFAGEHLHYKIYSLKSKTNTLSTFSKIGYVELVGENSSVVFRHKIRLKNGIGQGEFFIPVTVPSGNYKLIGYTQWMKNYGVDSFFQSDIGIINPFQNNQESILEHSPKSEKISFDNTEKEANRNNLISATLNKRIFKKRDKGVLTIGTSPKNEFDGDYSISIRRIDSIRRPLMPSAIDYTAPSTENTSFDEKHGYLPELRGELISGKIVPKDPNSSLEEEEIALSIPGKHFILKLTRTNTDGEFYFNLNQEYNSDDAFVQVLGENRGKYEIQIPDKPFINYENLKFDKMTITPEMAHLILKRSVYNQVENAFIEVKPDSIEQIDTVSPIYRQYSITYDLDDYTRFSTIRETASEILEHVWVRKDKNGEELFQIRGEENVAESNLLPLVLIDGILIQQHSDVIDFDARKIRRIHISREECVINAIVYKGIIALETIQGDFPQKFEREYVSNLKLFSPLPKKKYFNQEYNHATKSTSDQIPDFRQQLLWQPKLILDDDKTNIEFYTSDVAGKYEIYLEGFTNTGNPISVKEVFEVK